MHLRHGHRRGTGFPLGDWDTGFVVRAFAGSCWRTVVGVVGFRELTGCVFITPTGYLIVVLWWRYRETFSGMPVSS